MKILILVFIISININAMVCQEGMQPTQPLEISELLELATSIENRRFDPCAQTAEAPKTKQQLCSMKPRDFQSLLCGKEGKMGFDNEKGLLGLPTGVCWWHSRFHRNATYLAYYSPQKKKLDPDNKEDKKQLKKIIRNIARRKEIVEIPGYKSIREFTSDPKNEKLIQRFLQTWMAEDSFLKMNWVNGLIIPKNYNHKSKEFYMQQGKWRRNPEKDLGSDKLNELAQKAFERRTYDNDEEEEKAREKTLDHQQKQVDTLFDNVVNQNEISFITLQYPGVMAHSQIVFDAKKSLKNGKIVYDFKVQDSNYQGGLFENPFQENSYSQIRYIDGIWYKRIDPGTMDGASYTPINIAVHNDRKLKRIQRVFKRECGKELFE